jgi:segregation and condensation protein A
MNGDAITNELEQHLLFQKSLVDDDAGAEKINRYLRLLNDEQTGEKLSDPTDDYIRSVFRLVLDEKFDPWAIDLRDFVRVYSQKVTASKFDIIVAGKLVLMAWKVLKMQTDATKTVSEQADGESCDFGFDYDPEIFAEGEEPLHVPDIQLRGVYRRAPTRPVTMLELLDAFDEAREEIEVATERERVRLELQAKEPKKFRNDAHDEVDKNEIDRVWDRIQKIGTGAFAMSELFTSDISANIEVFLSVLELVRVGKLAVWQDELPYGEVMMEIKVDWMSGIVEDAQQTAVVKEATL